MKTPKTILIIECRTCNGNFFADDKKIVLHPGNESELPDELYIVTRKVSRCTSCKQNENRTRGGRKKRFER